MPIVILGLGNLLMTDDGVGVHAVRALNADPPPDTVVREVGTRVFDALAVLQAGARVIAIDAIDAGQPPGTVLQFELDYSDAPEAPPSLHDFDLPALVRSLPPSRRPRVVVVGVQPATVAPGLELSGTVAGSLPTLLRTVRELAAQRAAPQHSRGFRGRMSRHPR